MPKERLYQSTHPWLTFELDLNILTHGMWINLGEIASKCSHIAGAALLPEVASAMHSMFLTKGIHGTTSIEGNTLTEDEVGRRIHGDLPLPKSREYLGTEIDVLLELHNEIGRDISTGELRGLSVEKICEFNRRLLEGQPRKDEVVPGVTRTHSVTVGIGDYVGAPAEDCDYLLGRMVDWLNELSAPAGHPELSHPIAVLKAILAHLYLAWIHPFGDGNGRTARLVEFQLMIEAGTPTAAAHLLSNHYNRTREAYLVALHKTSRPPRYPLGIFLEYALQGLRDELRDQIEMIQRHQQHVMWEKIVHDSFQNEDTPARKRQRHIALDMDPLTPTPKNKMREASTRVAAEYAGAGPKTVSRDVNALLERNLIIRAGKGYLPNIALVDGLRPPILVDPLD
jgi:Fic family protein